MGPWSLATMSRNETQARRQGQPGPRARGSRPLPTGAGRARRRPTPAAVKTWLGFRLIGVGCRLARPSVVAGAEAGL